MAWVEQKDGPRLPPEAAVELWREAAAMKGGSPDALLHLGKALYQLGDTRGALGALAGFNERQPSHAEAWRLRASLYLDLEEHDAALHAAEQAGPVGQLLRARALIALDRKDEGERLLREMLSRDIQPAAFERLARLLARQGRGGALLELCLMCANARGCATIDLAYRAIALSLLGRGDEARRIVDPERHVKQVAFEPPPELGPINRFNAELAAQILRGHQPLAREGLAIDYDPDRRRIPNLSPLHDFFRRETAAYVDELPERGLADVMPPPPEHIRLHSGVTVLRGPGQHGDHIHPRGYVSCVYHVLVPDEISASDDRRGHLSIGTFEGLDRPGWQPRYLRPRAGVLTIFPAHFFHNVVPTGIVAPRVSVAGDLEPVNP